MKTFISIILIGLFITIIVLSCAAIDTIQVKTRYVRLSSKEWHWYSNEQIMRQYWDDMNLHYTYMQELPEGDTGERVGTVRVIFVSK